MVIFIFITRVIMRLTSHMICLCHTNESLSSFLYKIIYDILLKLRHEKWYNAVTNEKKEFLLKERIGGRGSANVYRKHSRISLSKEIVILRQRSSRYCHRKESPSPCRTESWYSNIEVKIFSIYMKYSVKSLIVDINLPTS